MNYFELHLGDYAEATGHLSMLEDAAYLRLLRKFYATEKPLPADISATQRLVGARSQDERDAVEVVLREFFELRDDGWHNNRADEELARFHSKQAKAKASADARWSAPASKTQSVPDATAMRTHSERTADALPTQSEGNALQAPSSKLHIKADAAEADASTASKRGTRLPKDWQPDESELRWAADARPDVDVKRQVESFRDFWTAKAGKDGTKLDWAATFRNWIRNARSGGNVTQFRSQQEPVSQARKPLT